MSQCVPDWDFDDSAGGGGGGHPTPPRRSLRSHSFNPGMSDVPMSNYEVAELTWENGQLAMHGLGPPRAPAKPLPSSTSPSKYAWVDKPRAAATNAASAGGAGTGTLECIVNQATALPRRKLPLDATAGDLVPWFDPSRGAAAATMTMDALVPCAGGAAEDRTTAHFVDSAPSGGIGKCVVGCSTRVGSCSGPAAPGTAHEEDGLAARKRARVARAPAEWSGMDQSASGSATFGRDSQQMTLDTGDMEIGAGMTSTSLGSPENTSSGKGCTRGAAAAAEDHDSVCHSRPPREGCDDEDDKKPIGKSSVSTKRSRAAAIHNQSERKRRDKINQRMKTLQKLVPNSSKTDKASVLDEVIEYLKQLQAQVQMVNRMNMQPIMMPMAMQQQLQMSMMGPMGMGLGMVGMGMPGMGMMDMNALGRSNLTGIPPVLHPAAAAFMPIGSWGDGGDRGSAAAAAPMVMPDPLSPFLASQSQPMTLDAYSRIAAMYAQQMHQPPPSGSKN